METIDSAREFIQKKEQKENILASLSSPADLRELNPVQLQALAAEIRELIIKVTSQQGGHLAPNLGVVELTIGLHLALESPKDKIIWDVGHQSYVHKLLTGRQREFSSLRQYGGLSGFPKRTESTHDIFDSGHASNSLSVALGLALGSRKKNGRETVVAVIGDGSLTGGMAYEALNQAGHLRPNLIVILNDNEWSIDGNVGAMSSYLNRMRLDPTYNRLRDEIEKALRRIPAIGERMVSFGETIKASLKQMLVPGMLFEELGFKYIGPIDGHNIEAVKQSVTLAKKVGGPILIHAITHKGRGYLPAEENPDRFHGTAPFNIKTGKPVTAKSEPLTYGKVFSKTLIELARKNKRLIAITAAMAQGTCLDSFAACYPNRFFDVGIAEQHAVTFAAGLALAGWQPVVAIYSTFLQRAYDQVIEDVCLQNLPIIFALDRAGLVGDDGPTHHGAFDLSYLSHIPGLIIMAPKDENEFRHMLYTATLIEKPVAIRYPRGSGLGVPLDKEFQSLPLGKGEILETGKDLGILAVGKMVAIAQDVRELLIKEGLHATLVNARFIKPLDKELITSLAQKHSLLVTMEDNATIGGFGASVAQLLSLSKTKVLNLGLPDSFIEHGPVKKLFLEIGLDPQSLKERILQGWQKIHGKD